MEPNENENGLATNGGEGEGSETPTPKKGAKKETTFTAEQLAVVNEMIAKSVRSSAINESSGVSVYGQRDPKSIESVNVKRMFGKFVIGFKDVQDDPLKKTPKYIKYQFDPIRKIHNQPYIVLLLSNNGKDIEEKEVIISDYYDLRENYQAKIIDIKVEKTIEDHGYLGNSNMAREIDGKGNVVSNNKVKAESIKETRKFYVELPGFAEPVEFLQDFFA